MIQLADVLMLMVTATQVPQSSFLPQEIAAIREFEQRQATAWNAHDIDSYAALYAEDADVVNVLGWHWKSRAELRTKLGAAFRTVFADSQLKIENVAVEPLSTELRLVHVRWSMTGARSPDGTVGNLPQQGIQTQVIKRKGDGWEIVAFQNTNAVPERPFPPPPPASPR
jgi:uncharacterized protein (TIGR02246 family)